MKETEIYLFYCFANRFIPAATKPYRYYLAVREGESV
jgi:hypothetical protein